MLELKVIMTFKFQWPYRIEENLRMKLGEQFVHPIQENAHMLNYITLQQIYEQTFLDFRPAINIVMHFLSWVFQTTQYQHITSSFALYWKTFVELLVFIWAARIKSWRVSRNRNIDPTLVVNQCQFEFQFKFLMSDFL